MITTFFTWFAQLTGFELILWVIALVASLLFALHAVFSAFFGGDHGDFDVDTDGDGGAGILTVRNFLAFFTMFGWAGLAALRAGLPQMGVVAVAVLSGASIVLVLYNIMRGTRRLKHDGTVRLSNAVSQVGETYLRIPGLRAGMGKVQVPVQGRYLELDAMTDDAADIPTGKPIRVTGILNERILLVSSTLNG